jgi:hypothetical protein
VVGQDRDSAGGRVEEADLPPVLAYNTYGTLMALGIQRAAGGAPVGGSKVYLLDFVTRLCVQDHGEVLEHCGSEEWARVADGGDEVRVAQHGPP